MVLLTLFLSPLLVLFISSLILGGGGGVVPFFSVNKCALSVCRGDEVLVGLCLARTGLGVRDLVFPELLAELLYPVVEDACTGK